MTEPPWRWRDKWKAALPTRETLAAHPWLRPVAGRLLDPQLWRVQHESVARGVAVGMLWAFTLPAAQMVMAAAHCTWWRANIPVAVAVTMVTNPLTIGFWLWLAYQVGAWVLGEPAMAVATPATGASVLPWLASIGRPALLGMTLFAIVGAVSGYLGVKAVWRLRVWLKRRARRGA